MLVVVLMLAMLMSLKAMAAAGVLGGVPASRLWPADTALDAVLLVAATETNTDDDVEALVEALQGALA